MQTQQDIEGDHVDLPTVLWGKQREGSPKVFASNLRLLTALKRLNGSTAADAVQSMLLERGEKELKRAKGRASASLERTLSEIRANPVDPKWYRRLMREGISRPNERTIRHLHAVALFFSIDFEELWDEELTTRLNLVQATDKEAPSPSPNVLYAKRVESLLDSGKFDFLKPLIDSLYRDFRKTRK